MVKNVAGLFREYMALERRRRSDEGLSMPEFQRRMNLKSTLNHHFQAGLDQRHEDRRER